MFALGKISVRVNCWPKVTYIYMYIPYSEKFWRTKKLANLANFIKTTKILVGQIFTPYELGRGRVENT